MTRQTVISGEPFELSSDDPQLLADWGYSLFLQGEYLEAEELTRQEHQSWLRHDTRIANNLAMIYQNSPLSPTVGPQSVPLMPDDQQGIVVAEALDPSFPGSEAEWLRARYEEESIHPFEDVALPEPASGAEVIAQALPDEAAAESVSNPKSQYYGRDGT